jgi:hypothetical protein
MICLIRKASCCGGEVLTAGGVLRMYVVTPIDHEAKWKTLDSWTTVLLDLALIPSAKTKKNSASTMVRKMPR